MLRNSKCYPQNFKVLVLYVAHKRHVIQVCWQFSLSGRPSLEEQQMTMFGSVLRILAWFLDRVIRIFASQSTNVTDLALIGFTSFYTPILITRGPTCTLQVLSESSHCCFLDVQNQGLMSSGSYPLFLLSLSPGLCKLQFTGPVTGPPFGWV